MERQNIIYYDKRCCSLSVISCNNFSGFSHLYIYRRDNPGRTILAFQLNNPFIF